jgi:muconolactone delta-isomerase
MEYLVTMTTQVPSGVVEDEVVDRCAGEAVRACELALEGRRCAPWRTDDVIPLRLHPTRCLRGSWATSSTTGRPSFAHPPDPTPFWSC